MITRHIVALWFAWLLGGLMAGVVPARAQAAADGIRPHAGMLRYPNVSRTHIVFVYANDLWVVPREGGKAAPLASPPGQEMFPRFSPDGRTVAFVGNYEGNRDLYTIPIEGGIATRVTYHPASEQLCGWTPDGRLLYSAGGVMGLGPMPKLYTTSPKGGLPQPLPVPYGTNGAISPDGRWLAYTPHSTDARTWKRYRGGMATDIWLFDLQEKKSRKITDWEGTDSLPMWSGATVFYLSDAGPEHRLNIWSFDTKSGRRKQVTRYTDYDVKWPSIGPGPNGGGEIVFQHGSGLYLLDIPSGKTRLVEVTIPGDRPALRVRAVDVVPFISGWDLSPTGKRAAIEARGDIWTAPAKEGTPRNLTCTSGVAERYPAWSPDGRWIAYFSDATGEYELYVTQSDGKGETRQLTKDGKTFRYRPVWSPNSRHIAYADKTGALYLYTLESGQTKLLDTDPWAAALNVSWSPDGRWLAYAKNNDRTRFSAIWLCNIETGEKKQITSGLFNDYAPVFDRKGDYLYFASSRSFRPIYEDLGTTWVYTGTHVLLAVPLRADIPSPFNPKSDEETWSDAGKGEHETRGGGAGQEKTAAPKAPEKIVIDFDGLEQRALLLPVRAGRFGRLAVNDRNQLLFVRLPYGGSEEPPAIKLFDLNDEKREEKMVASGASSFIPSADGKKILVLRGSTASIQDASPGATGESVVTSGMTAYIEPRAEWKQIFQEAWRIERDFFYDPNMHGVDWKGVRDHYAAMLEDCNNREDLGYVISEMIAELNAGHAYYGGGDLERQPSVTVGMLGVDYELRDGAYRIARIYQGAPWDVDARGPLSQPGVKVKEGDYLLAVNGAPVDTTKDPWAAFQGLAERVVTITVSDKPRRDGSARDVPVRLIGSEGTLRYRAWIERNRAYVEKQSGGRVGYIYVPDTGTNGQSELVRQFMGQIGKEALIIDERWNGGGQIPTRFIELLNRPITNYWARRDGNDWVWPPDTHPGPKCMLINGLAGSGGDAFPWYFRQARLGKLIGTRTWGGLIGLTGNPGLIDGGFVTAPTFAFYETNGTWGVEGHGVDPDIEVIDDPARMTDGGDPQLDAAIQHMLEEIRRNPYVPPKRPAYPNRSGFGLDPRDR